MERIIETKLDELLSALKESELMREYSAAKESVDSNETNKTLVREYESMQMNIQRAALSGTSPSSEDMEKFQRLAGLLMMSGDTQKYIINGMRVQQLVAEITGKIASAANFDLSALMNNLG
ncbi:MAG: YlbF family regulator [Oscillospiraceae bacterium]|jgi:cell fate (sporulation/competence/biofilm development) regulator YlbF (YheA/YmcA/DUF963 family)|nr:YlbF family regulator [Oscillospiraceae bacterium]